MPVKKVVKSCLPQIVIRAVRRYRAKKENAGVYPNLTTQQVFTRIYEEGVWGRSGDPSQRYFSGTGSHDPGITSIYTEAVRGFLGSFPGKPDVVDLGCGDFSVGANIRDLCASYIACDIVPPLIEFNRERFKPLNVDFRVLDLVGDELPQADVVFIRQVLQHLSNEHIARALPRICASYKYLVLTEHLPRAGVFRHNLDKPAGPGIRAGLESGIVLTSSPFSLQAKSERQLCQVRDADGIIRTTLYELR